MKEQFDDNDITIADMNVEGMPWYGKRSKESNKTGITLNRREKLLAIIGALEVVLPIILIYAVGILIIFLFMYFIWL